MNPNSVTPISVISNCRVILWPGVSFWVIGGLERRTLESQVTVSFNGIRNPGDTPVLVEHTGPYTVEYVTRTFLVKPTLPQPELKSATPLAVN